MCYFLHEGLHFNVWVTEWKTLWNNVFQIDCFRVWKDPVSKPIILHDSWWRHQMETFSELVAICAGNSPVPGEFPAQKPLTRGIDFSLICVWINGWVNNREAGDLRRYRAHYDVTVMYWLCCYGSSDCGWSLTNKFVFQLFNQLIVAWLRLMVS